MLTSVIYALSNLYIQSYIYKSEGVCINFANERSRNRQMDLLDKTTDLLNKGETDKVIQLLEMSIQETESPNDDLYYLLGNAYRKKGNWQLAINNYLEAIAINPNSPAKQAYEMAMNILNFYNKDMYNQ